MRSVGRQLSGQGGFTIIEVMVAAMVLVIGLGALLGMLMTASHAIKTTRLRQEETSIARELLEDARGLPYTSLNSNAIAAALQPMVPNSSVSGTNLVVTRAIAPQNGGYNFIASFTACSLDSPSDGIGNHDLPPASGGSWCPDVQANGTADSNPDDYKRLSVTVTPSTQSTPTVQQTNLIYNRPVNGPSVTCLSTTTSCPGTNVTIGPGGGSSQTFNVTTSFQAASIKWLVNGSPPTSNQLSSGEVDPYSPAGTQSSFNWVFPTTTYKGTKYTIDGNYTITAIAYDSNGNAGSASTLQVTVNEHQAIPPATFNSGWNDLMNGVELQWVPSVDQDIQYYRVYNEYNGATTPTLVCQVSTTSCTDTSAATQSHAPPFPGSRPTCTSGSQAYTKPNVYWVVGVDKDTSGAIRESTWTTATVDANLCNHPPSAPTNLTATLSGGQVALSWTAPSPADPDSSWDSIQAWRVYRWPSGGGVSDPGSRYELVGTSPSSPVTSFTDPTADPGGVTQNYCVTAVDTHLDESFCSNIQTK